MGTSLSGGSYPSWINGYVCEFDIENVVIFGVEKKIVVWFNVRREKGPPPAGNPKNSGRRR